jgi:hypothetical protein
MNRTQPWPSPSPPREERGKGRGGPDFPRFMVPMQVRKGTWLPMNRTHPQASPSPPPLRRRASAASREERGKGRGGRGSLQFMVPMRIQFWRSRLLMNRPSGTAKRGLLSPTLPRRSGGRRQRRASRRLPGFMVPLHAQRRKEAFHEPCWTDRNMNVEHSTSNFQPRTRTARLSGVLVRGSMFDVECSTFAVPVFARPVRGFNARGYREFSP